MVEGVLVEQVGLVDEEDREDALLGEILDVRADRVEDVAGGVMLAWQTEGDAELPVEVTPAERDVVAVGQAEALAPEGMAKSAEETSLACSRLAGEHRALRACTVSSSSSSIACLEGGIHRSASSTSFEKGSADMVKTERRSGVMTSLPSHRRHGASGRASDRAGWSRGRSRRARGEVRRGWRSRAGAYRF